ncbi:MAG: methylated-DNA--[Campylobacter sp.]|nr:methylated-DNA--[protein]-cysteine S-methyltransferase [Campylobacter sp.]
MKYFWRYNSPLGEIFMQSDGINLTALKLGEFNDFGVEFREQNLQIFEDTCLWLDIYFSGNLPNFTPKISLNSLNGSEFAKQIWQILLQIPYGKTTSYSEIAQKIAIQKGIAKMSAQAVGGAIGKNPIAIIIPCHRVIGTSGKLVGYAYGIDKKEFLLNLERSNLKF